MLVVESEQCVTQKNDVWSSSIVPICTHIHYASIYFLILTIKQFLIIKYPKCNYLFLWLCFKMHHVIERQYTKIFVS